MNLGSHGIRCRPASGSRPQPRAWSAGLCLVLGLLRWPASGAPRRPRSPAETTWESCYVHGEKVGYIETTIRKIRQKTRQLLQIDSHSQIGIRRFGDTNQMDVQTTSVESPGGEVRHFTVTTKMGGSQSPSVAKSPATSCCSKRKSRLEDRKASMPWRTDIKGFQGIEHSLEREPMQPGEIREMAVLVPVANQIIVAQVDLIARQLESTRLLDGSRDLLHIDCQLTPVGAKGKGIQTVLWTDERGRTIKTFVPGIQQEGYRTTREQALEPPKGFAVRPRL